MKALAITDTGIEKVALLELDELIKVKGKADSHAVIFNPKSEEDLFKFCYFSQSTERVILLLSDFEFKKCKDFLSKSEAGLKKFKVKEWFDKNISFKVECKRIGEHDFGSHTIEEEFGGQIISLVNKELGFEPRVNLENPDIVFYVLIVNNKAYLGIDLIGKDLSKRQYRVFSSPGVVNANLAYSIIRLAGYNGKQRLVDVFSKAGLVCIEAALYASKLSINYYSKEFAFRKLKPFKNKDWNKFFSKLDSKADNKNQLNILGLDSVLRNLEASKKNAKLAGVDKIISFSKMDVEWLDTKLDKASVDIIASRIPCPSKHTPKSFVQKIYKELFYQSEFVMKKGSRMALLTENMNLLKEMITPAFKLVKEDELWAGKQRYEFVLIERLFKKN